MRVPPFFPALALAILPVLPSAHAASASVQVTDSGGQPLADAVVYAEPASGQTVPKPHGVVEIEQKGRKFIPLVTVVQTGTDIAFPNNDTVRHHVYSLSPAKVFELKLYSGKPSNPVAFDKPGTVVLGCNIHDTMVAYIHIVNTPWFAKTDAAGHAKIDGLPSGKFLLKAWHYRLPAGVPVAEQPLALTTENGNASFKLGTKP